MEVEILKQALDLIALRFDILCCPDPLELKRAVAAISSGS